MYRCRSLLSLLREKTVYTAHAQVARCGFQSSQQFSQRQFSDSANAAKLVNEEENNDKVPSKKVTNKKLFSFDKLYEVEKKLSEKERHKADVVQEVLSAKVESKVSVESSVKKAESNFENFEIEELNKERKKNEKVKNKKQKKVKKMSQEQISSSNDDAANLNGKPSGNNVSIESLFEDEKQISSVENEQTEKLNNIQEIETTKSEPQVFDQSVEISDTSVDVKGEREESVGDLEMEMKIEDEKMKDNKEWLRPFRKAGSDQQITKTIFAMNRPEQVLSTLSICFEETLSSKKMMMLIICAVQKLKSLESVTFTPKLANSLNDFLVKDSTISKIGSPSLLKILEFFLMRSSVDDSVTDTLLHELCWRLRNSSLRETMDILAMVKLRVTTPKRKEVYELANERLKEIIGETSTPQELLTLMYIVQDSETLRRVEEEALNMVQALDCIQSYKLLNLLVKRKSKNFSLVQQVKDQLFSRPLTLNAEQLRNVFFICSTLHEHDTKYLKELSVHMLDSMESESVPMQSSSLIAVLHSCSILGWNYKKLSNKILQDLSNNSNLFEEKNGKALTSMVMSLCHLNLENYGEFCGKIARRLISNKTVTESLQLDIIKSLASIKIAEKEEVLTVLQPAFYQPMLDKLKDSPKFLQNITKSKLLRLYGYLKEDLKVESPEVDTMASELRQQIQAEINSKPSSNFAKSVGDVVTRIGPLHTYTNVNVVSKYGYTIDFELFVNQNLKAVRLEDKDGAQKIWIKALPRNAFVVEDDSVTLSSDTAMMIRHLQSEKDTSIIFIDYFKWFERSQKFDHMLYIESLIKTAINGDTNGTELDTGKKE